MPRSLSKKESEVVLELEWKHQQYVTINDVISLLNCSYDYAKKICYRLVEKKWLEPVSKGKYILIAADTGTQGIPSSNTLLVGSFLVKPYYYSYSTATAFYGFSTQMPTTVYIATTQNKHMVKRGDCLYRFIRLSKWKFFGFTSVRVFDSDVLMADKEKAIIDSMDKMKYTGGLREVADVVKNGVKKVHVPTLMNYAIKMKSHTLIQRLGFLLECYDIFFDENILRKHIGNTVVFLDPYGKKKGVFVKKWGIIQNSSKDRYA